MEHGLGEDEEPTDLWALFVLILVLMEHGLGERGKVSYYY